MNAGDVLWEAVIAPSDSPNPVETRKWKVVRLTPKGMWLEEIFNSHYQVSDEGWARNQIWRARTNQRYTKNLRDAQLHLMHRMRKRKKMLDLQLQRCERCINKIVLRAIN